MPHYALDGMDIDVVREGIQTAVDRARAGGGPTLIEAKTYRFAGHSRADQALYRPEGELDSWKSRDPILLLEERAKKIGKMSESAVADMKARIAKEIEATVALCQGAPEPSPKTMFENIWSRKVSK
jgi:pyruvate dehydrogenase E1 component alpha subunit